MKTAHDIVNSLLSGFQVVRLQAGGLLPEEMLAVVDQMIEEASVKSDTLGNPENVAVHPAIEAIRRALPAED